MLSLNQDISYSLTLYYITLENIIKKQKIRKKKKNPRNSVFKKHSIWICLRYL